MANEEHLAILKKGVGVWNRWRDRNLEIKPDLSEANLSEANLSEADLREANLLNANLYHARLSRADLQWADLSYATFRKANFAHSLMERASLGDVDLSAAKGLETVRHSNPPSIGIDTIFLSHGSIPEIFLRGAGVPEPFIVQMKALVAAMEPIQFHSCFISYSSKDGEFAERLHADLQSRGNKVLVRTEGNEDRRPNPAED